MTRIENLFDFLKTQGQLNMQEHPKKKKPVRKQIELPGAQKREAPGTLWVGPYWYKEPRMF